MSSWNIHPSTSAVRLATTLLVFGLFATGSAQGAPPLTTSPHTEHAIPFVPLTSEPPPTLSVEAPLAGPLQRGAAIIPYKTANFRILPIFGSAAVGVSPRAGHLHVTVDDLPWRWADTGDNGAVVVVGLPPGPHKVRIDLATPEHQVLTGSEVGFIIPPAGKARP